MESHSQLANTPAELFLPLLAAVFKRAVMDVRSGTPGERNDALEFLIVAAPLVEHFGLNPEAFDEHVDRLCERHRPGRRVA